MKVEDILKNNTWGVSEIENIDNNEFNTMQIISRTSNTFDIYFLLGNDIKFSLENKSKSFLEKLVNKLNYKEGIE